MNVILLEPVDKLGEAGALVTVKDGFARNWLIPQGLALPATRANQAELQARLAQRAKQLAERKADAERLAEILKDAELNIQVRAGEGRIYGSVGNKDIAAALKSTYDVDIDRRKLVLGEPIKTTGEHQVVYRPHPEVPIPIKVNVVAEIG
ncbi:MAG TPA: 50S ribosomal protein L9 [Trueperaceae bacterium]